MNTMDEVKRCRKKIFNIKKENKRLKWEIKKLKAKADYLQQIFDGIGER